MYKKGCGKKSQISMFIIIGIILVIVVSFFLYFTYSSNLTTNEKYDLLEDKVGVVQNYVDECLIKVVDDATELVSYQGGFTIEPNLGFKRDDYTIAYDYYLGVNLLPTYKEVGDEQISVYIEEFLPKCLKKTDILKPNYVSVGEIDVDVTVDTDFFDVYVNYPITLSVEGRQRVLNGFETRKEVTLGIMLDVAYDIIENVKQDPNYIDVGYLESLGLDVEIIYIDDQTIIYKLNDPDFDNFFMFGTYFSSNSDPDLFTFPEYNVRVGDTLEVLPFALDFDDDLLTYSSADVDIDPVTGLIVFNPSSSGDYLFNIRVEDVYGAFDSEVLKVSVV